MFFTKRDKLKITTSYSKFLDPSPQICIDRASSADCASWKKSGFCSQHSALIYHCKKTCDFCSSGTCMRASKEIFVKMDNSSKCKLLLIERFFWIGRLIISFVSCILSQTGAKILYNFARQKTERVQIRYNQRLQILKAPIAFPQITASI